MPIEITPNGTYGASVPNLPRPLMKLMFGIVTPILRLTGAKILTLTTVGSKSGREHKVDLGWFPDTNNRWLIVASLAGAAKNPAWYYNMARNPDKIWITVDGRTIKVQGESLKGDERAAKYKEIVAIAPTYGGYETKTDARFR